MSAPIIIIGTGLAGITTAREFRKLDSDTELVLVTQDDGAVYSKPMLSNAFQTGKTAENLVQQTQEQLAQQLNATVMPYASVREIDPTGHVLYIGNKKLAYSKLVFAVGANPIIPPVAGDAANNIFSVNNLSDYARFRASLRESAHVGVIGAGLIGCEFANDMAPKGYRVSVIAPISAPMGHVIPEQAGRFLQTKLAEAGVDWHLNTSVVAVNRNSSQFDMVLKNGATVTVDIVLSAIGLRPNTTLAAQSGIAVNRGIVTNEYLETNAPGVYALGDCAEVKGLVLPFVLPIMNAARALAKTLANEKTNVTYPAMPVVMKTPACPTVISVPPHGMQAEWACETDESGVKCLCHDAHGKLTGFVLCGEYSKERQALAKELPPVLA